MILKRPELKELVLTIAREKYVGRTFERRPLMLAVEQRIKENGMWEEDDDIMSGSRGIKSRGLANIDWAVSQLYDEGRLTRVERNRYILPKPN